MENNLFKYSCKTVNILPNSKYIRYLFQLKLSFNRNCQSITDTQDSNQMLPYFSQLAKVFSQGKYYVGGPRNVQICRNCLLTNTLIMRFCLFIVVINCCLSRTVNGTCVPICLFTVQTNTPLSTEMILLVKIQI
jgi:hypothetical protein